MGSKEKDKLKGEAKQAAKAAKAEAAKAAKAAKAEAAKAAKAAKAEAAKAAKDAKKAAKAAKTKADKKVKEGKDKISAMHSIQGRMFMIAAAAVVGTVVIVCCVAVPAVQTMLTDQIHSTMLSLTDTYGEAIETLAAEKAAEGGNITPYQISQYVDEINISGCESAECYVVYISTGAYRYSESSMLLGMTCSNSLVTDLCSRINAGEYLVSEVYEYTEVNTTYYATVYYSKTYDFLLVTSIEKSDIIALLNSLMYKIILAGIATCVIFMLIAYFASSMCVRPLREIIGVLDEIAQLDLTEKPSLQRLSKNKGEAGKIAQAVRTMRISLSEIVNDVRSQSAHLYGASEELDTNVTQTAQNVDGVEHAVSEIARGANSQAGETEKATSDVVRMGNMIEETTLEVTNLNETASMMRQSNETAAKVLAELEQINRQAVESIQVIAEQTNTTNTSAKKIQEATALITSIADETSLLSLNASIEAARAGEAGRGFAVVATEIQKLADQSSGSARHIDEIIRQLISDSQQAVTTMEEVKAIMARQNENLQQTSLVFEEVRKGIGASIVGVDGIAGRTTELNIARNGIIDTVQSLTAIAEQNAASTQETTATVTEINEVLQKISQNATYLKEIAAVMEDNMNKFKL